MSASTQSELIFDKPQPMDQNAAAVYISSLPSETGRRTQAQALRVIAQVLGTDLDRLNWGALRDRHTAAIRAKIAQSYSPATFPDLDKFAQQHRARCAILPEPRPIPGESAD